MSDEEPKRPAGEFRVVDKRISARTESSAPAEPAPPAPEQAPSPAAPSDPGPAVSPPPEGPADVAQPGVGPGGEEAIWTPEQEAEAQRFVQEIAQRPSLEWVVNTAVTLANVAGTKLDLGHAADAQLAIDALAALVEKLGSRLDQAEAPLRQTLAQLQLAYAQRVVPKTPPGQ